MRTKDFEQIISATDDYTSATGGDYYEGGGIDVSLYDKARIFPGLVDTLTEKRVDEQVVNIDMAYRSAKAVNVNLSNDFSGYLQHGALCRCRRENNSDVG